MTSLLAAAAVASSALAQGGPPPAPVRVDAVRLETIAPKRLVTGELRAVRRSIVATREPGLVIDMPVREGQRLRAGETIARLDADRLELDLARLEADRKVAVAIRDERDAQVAQNQRDLEVLRESFERGGAYPKEVSDAESAVRIAEARLAQAKRSIDVIDAQLALLQDRIEDTTITAPFDGVVVARETEVGEWIGEGAGVIDLLAVGSIEAWLDVPQSNYAAVNATDEPVTIEVEATGETIDTDRLRVLPQIDPQARTFVTVATLNNADGSLAPGMSVTAWIPTRERAERLTVPKAAVGQSEAGPYVFVARDGGESQPARAVPVRIEVLFPLTDRFVVRTDQLAEGDRVIVEGNERLFPNAPVRITGEAAMRADGGESE